MELVKHVYYTLLNYVILKENAADGNKHCHYGILQNNLDVLKKLVVTVGCPLLY